MKKNVLPDSLFIPRQEEKAREKFDSLEKALQKYVARISELRNVKFSSVKQLEGITHEWLESEIKKSKDNLSKFFGAGGFIPQGIASQFNDEYNKVRSECEQPINGVQDHLSRCKQFGIGLTVDVDGVPHFDEKDVEALIAKESTRVFSDMEKGLYPLLVTLFDTMNDIHRYEAAMGAEPSSLSSVITDHIQAETLRGKKVYDFTPEDYVSLLNWGRVLFVKPKAEESDEDNDHVAVPV